MTSRATAMGVVLLGLIWTACGGKNTVLVDIEPALAGGSAGMATSAGGAGGQVSAGGTSLGAAGSATAGAADSGGSSAGTAQAAGGGGNSSECLTDADCTAANACVVVSCRAGSCASVNVVKGALPSRDMPADCHATACDGQGHVVQVLDLGNVPAASASCVLPTCDDDGNPSSTPSPAGDVCQSAQGGRVCDGAGTCVECLTSADCALGTCVQHQCASATCADGQQDGTETDVDCGGVCPLCSDKKRCKVDQDCASDDCDALELVCLPASCIDQKQDGSETDVDCGGKDCAGCYPLKKCLVDSDCATQKCDPVGRKCAGNACADHRQDGTESDVDCGGYDCTGCTVGQRCNSGFDCRGGMFCNMQQTPFVCARF